MLLYQCCYSTRTTVYWLVPGLDTSSSSPASEPSPSLSHQPGRGRCYRGGRMPTTTVSSLTKPDGVSPGLHRVTKTHARAQPPRNQEVVSTSVPLSHAVSWLSIFDPGSSAMSHGPFPPGDAYRAVGIEECARPKTAPTLSRLMLNITSRSPPFVSVELRKQDWPSWETVVFMVDTQLPTGHEEGPQNTSKGRLL